MNDDINIYKRIVFDAEIWVGIALKAQYHQSLETSLLWPSCEYMSIDELSVWVVTK